MVMRRGDDSDFKDKMSKKNKELTEYLDEIKVLNYFLLCLCNCALSLSKTMLTLGLLKNLKGP